MSIKIPETVTFQQAIALTESLLSQIDASAISDSETTDAIAHLVKTENGARGFFVTYLTSDVSIADNPPTSVVQALQSSPDVVAELLVKNLAMSATQAMYHRRNHKEDMAEDSERVRQRTERLIQLVDLSAVYDRAQKLMESATTGEGEYKAFLERWDYDAEQRQVMAQALQQIIPEPR